PRNVRPEARISTLCWADRKSTRLNSSHANISYAVFCLKKKRTQQAAPQTGDRPRGITPRRGSVARVVDRVDLNTIGAVAPLAECLLLQCFLFLINGPTTEFPPLSRQAALHF